MRARAGLRTIVIACSISAVVGVGVNAALPASASTLTARAECTIVGTSGADTLRGTPGDDVICGRGGDDLIRGRGGDDAIRGGAGDDRIYGGPGEDDLDGGAGDDVLDDRLDYVPEGEGGAGGPAIPEDWMQVKFLVKTDFPGDKMVSIGGFTTSGGESRCFALPVSGAKAADGGTTVVVLAYTRKNCPNDVLVSFLVSATRGTHWYHVAKGTLRPYQEPGKADAVFGDCISDTRPRLSCDISDRTDASKSTVVSIRVGL